MRKKRLAEILSIVRENEIENQEQLISILNTRGFKVTQATVSRDINELGLEKAMSDNGVYCYMTRSADNNNKFQSIFSHSVISVDYALNTVVLKCHSGLAGAACAAVDSMKLPSIVGTLAGDDTVFILSRSEEDARRLTDKISSRMFGKK